MKKILALLIALVILIAPTQVFATEANLKCAPATGTYQVGQTFTVTYTMDTRGFPVWGADIEATYDSGVIEAQGTQSTLLTSTTGWSTAVANTIDSSLGKISLDFGNAQAQFTGEADMGSVTFTGKTAGQAQFNFVFFQQFDNTTPGVAKIWGKKDGTNLSNILTEVNNCIFVIEGAAVPTTPPGVPTPTLPPGVTAAPTELPATGSVGDTVNLMGLAAIFLIGGVSAKLALRKNS